MKALFSGIAAAAVAGLLAGGAMKPELNLGDRPEGPQMFAGWSGTRSTGPFDDGMTFASFNGQVPDYVLGTDWQKTMAWSEEAAQVHEDYEATTEVAAAEPEVRPMAFTGSAFDEPAREPVTYPSMDGGVAYGPQAEPPAASPEPPPGASLG